MYKLFALASLIVRNFILPNPFERLKNGLVINWGIEPILHCITFLVVGLFYQRGSAPVLGSFLYLVFYTVHTGLLMLCSLFSFEIFAIIIIISSYIIVLVGAIILKYKLKN